MKEREETPYIPGGEDRILSQELVEEYAEHVGEQTFMNWIKRFFSNYEEYLYWYQNLPEEYR